MYLQVIFFFVSVGTWTKWTGTTTYYDQLATSFRHGELSLSEKPDPELLKLQNPYNPELRSGIEYPTDISLYKGIFYLYFGPVPALILASVKGFITSEVKDQNLVFVFALGIVLIQSLLMINIWKKFFSNIPAWLILPGILTAGLISPYGWMLSLGTIYNVAILSGQFFFLAGLYLAFSMVGDAIISKPKLALIGGCWIFAIGSRITQAVPTGFMSILVLIWIMRKHREEEIFLLKSLFTIFCFGLPIFIGVFGLGWYNWARFDSIFETGVTYQLAGFNLQQHQQELFSPLYIANNIYNYFLIPPSFSKKFPFLSPVRGHNESVATFIHLPNIYYSQQTAGLIFIAPVILFSIVSIIAALKIIHKGSKLFNEKQDFSFNWMLISLSASFLSSLLFFLFFFWAGVRYQADFMPALLLLSIIGFWKIYHYIAKQPILRTLYTALGLGLTAITIINSNLVVLSLNSAQYREFNPLLWEQLIVFFQKHIH